MSVFTIEVSRPGRFGLETSATLELPATWQEFLDAKQKARVTDDTVIYSSGLVDCKYDWLTPHIVNSTNPSELNLLAERLESHIKDDIDILEAMVKIETRRNNGQPIPLPRLINLTFSIGNCQVVGNITSDALLGRFLFDNDFLSEEDAAAIQTRIDSKQNVSELLATLGKEHRINIGGILTASGCYIEFDGGVNEAYIPGSMDTLDHPSAPMIMEIFKRTGNDQLKTATLDMPPYTINAISEAFKKVGVKSLRECGYHCTDCLIPPAKEWINSAGDIEKAYNFAITLDRFALHEGVVELKALLEATKCSDLDTAMSMADDISDYKLIAEFSGAEDYARDYLGRLQADTGGLDLSGFVNLYKLGKKVMEQDNAIWTSYGILKRLDGGPILSQSDIPNMRMEMA